MKRRFAEVEADFAKNLALLKRDVLNEEEFRKANEARREERTRLGARQAELSEWVAQQHDREEAVDTLPSRVRSSPRGFPGPRHTSGQGLAPDDPRGSPGLPRRADRIRVSDLTLPPSTSRAPN